MKSALCDFFKGEFTLAQMLVLLVILMGGISILIRVLDPYLHISK